MAVELTVVTPNAVQPKRHSGHPFHERPVGSLALNECEEYIVYLGGRVRWIDAQLADRDKRTFDGRRLSDHEYHAWRRRAVAAKVALTNRLVSVKKHRHTLLQAEHQPKDGSVPKRGDAHLLHMVVLVRKWLEEFDLGDDVDDDERRQIEHATSWLTTRYGDDVLTDGAS